MRPSFAVAAAVALHLVPCPSMAAQTDTMPTLGPIARMAVGFDDRAAFAARLAADVSALAKDGVLAAATADPVVLAFFRSAQVAAMAAYDVDRDGRLTPGEIQTAAGGPWMAAMDRSTAHRRFRELDVDANLVLSPLEAATVTGSFDRRMARIAAYLGYDTNGDGRLDAAEMGRLVDAAWATRTGAAEATTATP